MANVRERPTANGQPRFVVQFRHRGKQTSITLLKKRDAEKARDLINALGPDEALVRLHGAAGKTGGMPTVNEWLTRHIDDLTGVTDRSKADYRSLAQRHVVPLLGPLDVDEVTPADVARWANQLEQKLSAKSIANLRALLSSAFGYAVDEGLRSDNPMRRLRRSRSGEHKRAEMVCLTAQEFNHLRSFLPEHWRPFATFLVGTGLRFGEAVALRVSDADLLAETPVVRVTKSWRRTPGGFEVGPPKSRKSRRTVSLPRDVVDALAPLVTRPGAELLFTNPQGNRVLHANFWNRVWKPAVEEFAAETGKRPRVHDLRHCYASWLLAAGASLDEVQDALGHESINTTISVYRHMLPGQHAKVAAALDRIFDAGRTTSHSADQPQAY